MSLLAAASYDPETAVEVATNALKAMTALDTTNLRVTFKAPTNGSVLVRLKGQVHGATTFPRLQFGVLEGATLKGRVSPIGSSMNSAATTIMAQESLFLVTGLTPTTEYTWDAAYGVEIVGVETSKIKYGGPNDTTEKNAWGPFIFEVWETANLLGGTLYDPTTAINKVTTGLLAMTALDTTNLRLKFTAPASGKVLWRINGQVHGATTAPAILLGILESATVKSRTAPIMGNPTTALATACASVEASGVVTGLTPTTEYTWDAAYGVEALVASTGFKYGGPNNTTTNDAFGGVAFEIWTA